MLTTYHHPVPLSRNLGTLTSWNPLGLSRPVMGLLYQTKASGKIGSSGVKVTGNVEQRFETDIHTYIHTYIPLCEDIGNFSDS